MGLSGFVEITKVIADLFYEDGEDVYFLSLNDGSFYRSNCCKYGEFVLFVDTLEMFITMHGIDMEIYVKEEASWK